MRNRNKKSVMNNPPRERLCFRCQLIWTGRTSVLGYSRCSHCYSEHSPVESEQAVRNAADRRRMQAVVAAAAEPESPIQPPAAPPVPPSPPLPNSTWEPLWE
jgi:hypothetical protein